MLEREYTDYFKSVIPDIAIDYRRFLAATQSVTSTGLEDMSPISL